MIPAADRRKFTPARRAQGFRSQAHLDAFYAHFDHIATCTECGPGAPVELDDGLQPTLRECAEGLRLLAASFADEFPDEPAAQPAHDGPTVSAVIPDTRKAKRTPEYVCYVRNGDRVDVLRGDRDRVEAERAALIAAGAQER